MESVGAYRRDGYVMGPRVPPIRFRDRGDVATPVSGLQGPSRVMARDASTSTCGPNDNTGTCEKPVGSSSMTLPIVLGVA
jgi:hypothetical protein